MFGLSQSAQLLHVPSLQLLLSLGQNGMINLDPAEILGYQSLLDQLYSGV